MKCENKEKLDFSRNHIIEIAERLIKGTITEAELREAAENTSKIVGMPVRWMGNPFDHKEIELTQSDLLQCRNKKEGEEEWDIDVMLQTFILN